MKLLVGVLLLAQLTGEYEQQVTGTYVRYEGAEPESAFLPCGSKRAWSVEGGAAFAELVKGYGKASKDKHGGVMATLRLRITPTAEDKEDHGHYDATATVVDVVNLGA